MSCDYDLNYIKFSKYYNIAVCIDTVVQAYMPGKHINTYINHIIYQS